MQTFWRITLPAIRWGVGYGVVLSTARALGEFGAVAVVSGRLSGATETRRCACRSFETFDPAGRTRHALVLAIDGTRVAVLHEPVGRRRRGRPSNGIESATSQEVR